MANPNAEYITQPGDYLFPPPEGADPSHDIAAKVLAERGVPTTADARAQQLSELRSGIAHLNHMAPGDELANPLHAGFMLQIPTEKR
jgi:hypothetical protein